MTSRIFAVTRSGLVALSISVAALWACVGAEAATRHLADREATASIRRLAELRRAIGKSDLTPAREPRPVSNRPRPSIS